MSKTHHYSLTTQWTGNQGTGTDSYTTYYRNHNIIAGDKTPIAGSSDPAFRGDKTRYNPEELLLASLSSCHMLWYLHLCADSGVIVVDYTDKATGTMTETSDGGGRFTEVTLNPRVKVKDAAMIAKANEMHKKASELCYIANSVNFPVHHQPMCGVE